MLVWITLQQVLILITLIFIGYFFRKKGLITDHGRKVLASLLVNLFSPCYAIMSLSTIVTINDLQKYAILFAGGIIFAIISVFVAIPIAKLVGKDRFHQNIYKYAFAFGNVGYFGYPLVNAVFGAAARAQMIMFSIPLNLASASYGYHVLTDPVSMDGKLPEIKIPLRGKLKRFFSIPMLSSIVGVFLGLLSSGLNFTISSIFTDFFTMVGNCQSVPAMLITGASLATMPLKKLLSSMKAYLVAMLRLLGLPLIISGFVAIIFLFGWHDSNFMRVAFFAIVSSAMPVGMNVVIYPESIGLDSSEGAKTCFISYVLALICIPIVFLILMKILTVTF